MGENVKNIEIAKNLQKGSLIVMSVFFKQQEILFCNKKKSGNRTINTEDM